MSDFKVVYKCGHLELEWWKDANEWSIASMDEECAEIYGILPSRHCSSLKGRDRLAWSLNPKGIFTISSGY